MSKNKILGKVKFHGKGGYDSEQEEAGRLLVVGKSYNVLHVSIGNWISYYTLEGFDRTFNTVLFEDSPVFEEAKNKFWKNYFGEIEE